MPITFKTSDKPVEGFKGTGQTFENVFTNYNAYTKLAGGKILQSSKGDNLPKYTSFCNGFIGSVYSAYCRHHNLVLRPDDLWLAILIQFSLYVNKNADALRHHFVKHEGKKELVVKQEATLESANYTEMAGQLVDLIDENLVDDTVKSWIYPSFTTTEENDRIVASITMMSSMQKYFDFKMELCCGIPETTLLGEPSDWENIRARLDKLLEYDLDGHMKSWHEMLVSILDEFVKSSKGDVNQEFWAKICDNRAGGSGPDYFSGWIAAFTVFDKDGKWIGGQKSLVTWCKESIDGGDYPVIDFNDVAPGMAYVPIKIDDNGVERDSYAFGGHLTFDVIKDDTTLQPRSDWAFALVKN